MRSGSSPPLRGREGRRNGWRVPAPAAARTCRSRYRPPRLCPRSAAGAAPGLVRGARAGQASRGRHDRELQRGGGCQGDAAVPRDAAAEGKEQTPLPGPAADFASERCRSPFLPRNCPQVPVPSGAFPSPRCCPAVTPLSAGSTPDYQPVLGTRLRLGRFAPPSASNARGGGPGEAGAEGPVQGTELRAALAGELGAAGCAAPASTAGPGRAPSARLPHVDLPGLGWLSGQPPGTPPHQKGTWAVSTRA